jgi:N-acetylneuraminate synthase
MEGLRRPYLVAEIGSNHLGSIDRALALIDAAALAGFDAVKFQHYRLERLFSPWALEHYPELLERRRYELPSSALWLLYDRAHDRGLELGFTPCSLEELIDCSIPCDFLKASSYDLLRLDLLEAIGGYVNRPVILSTGMATLEEVQEAVEALRQGGCQDLTLLHCVSLYPTRPEELNLRAILTLREAFPGCKVGMSLHTNNPSWAARTDFLCRPEVLEVHFDLQDQRGAETFHSWTPSSMEAYDLWRTASDHRIQPFELEMLGTGIKAPQPRELPERLWRADPSDGLRPLKEARR